MRTHIVLDDRLIQEALSTPARRPSALVDQTLREFVENHRRRDLMDLFGQGGIRADYNYQQLRSGDA